MVEWLVGLKRFRGWKLKKSSCILCGSEESQLLFEIPDLWLDRFDVTAHYVKCKECGLIYQSVSSAHAKNEPYTSEYPPFIPSRDQFSDRGLKRRCQVITQRKTSGTLLDIGSADGSFLDIMSGVYHWDVIGIEPDKDMAIHSQRELNLNVIHGTLADHHFEDRLFDVVTLWDVLEHLPNPKQALGEIRRILGDDGLIILRLPNYGSIDARIFGKCWAGWDSPRHLFVFTKQTLRQLLVESGFDIKTIRTDIGEYLNFVKSIQFWLTNIQTNPNGKNIILKVLRSVYLRILALPFTALIALCKCGSEMVVIAEPASVKQDPG